MKRYSNDIEMLANRKFPSQSLRLMDEIWWNLAPNVKSTWWCTWEQQLCREYLHPRALHVRISFHLAPGKPWKKGSIAHPFHVYNMMVFLPLSLHTPRTVTVSQRNLKTCAMDIFSKLGAPKFGWSFAQQAISERFGGVRPAPIWVDRPQTHHGPVRCSDQTLVRAP